VARIHEPRDEWYLLNRLNLFNQEWRTHAELGVTFFDRIFVGAVRINDLDLIAPYENEFAFVGSP
jgi:hypothetical protein